MVIGVYIMVMIVLNHQKWTWTSNHWFVRMQTINRIVVRTNSLWNRWTHCSGLLFGRGDTWWLHSSTRSVPSFVLIKIITSPMWMCICGPGPVCVCVVIIAAWTQLEHNNSDEAVMSIRWKGPICLLPCLLVHSLKNKASKNASLVTGRTYWIIHGPANCCHSHRIPDDNHTQSCQWQRTQGTSFVNTCSPNKKATTHLKKEPKWIENNLLVLFLVKNGLQVECFDNHHRCCWQHELNLINQWPNVKCQLIARTMLTNQIIDSGYWT